MPLTLEDIKLRAEIAEHIVAMIVEDRENGLKYLDSEVRNSANKKITPAMRVTVLALALARNAITVDDVAPSLAEQVLEKWLKEAAWRERDVAAASGTDVHDLAERVSQGEVVETPESYQAHINSWHAWREHYGMTFIETEFTVFNMQHGYAGTGDFLGYSELHPEWGLILGDYKTSKSGIWPSIALQLAAIKYAEFIARCKTCPHPNNDHPLGDLWEDRSILGDIKTCVGVQITAEGFHVVPARVTRWHFNTFLNALAISKWKDEGEKFALLSDSEPKVSVNQ